MAPRESDPEEVMTTTTSSSSRRKLLRGVAATVGTALVAPRWARAQAAAAGPMAPPSTITQPPRDFGPLGAPTTYFTDPDVLTLSLIHI